MSFGENNSALNLEAVICFNARTAWRSPALFVSCPALLGRRRVKCRSVWQHRIRQHVICTPCAIIFGHVWMFGKSLQSETTWPAVHKRKRAPRIRFLMHWQPPQASQKCFYQYSPPRLLLHLPLLLPLFQHPPTMWYMRSAAAPQVGHQCKALNPMGASHSLSALAWLRATCIGVTTSWWRCPTLPVTSMGSTWLPKR